MRIPTVALVGRPNVGKSTIFNKLVGKKISIIEDTPGVTRDRIYGDVVYNNYKFHLIDTGGIDLSDADFNKEIIVQATLAIDEADVIIFIIDGKEDLNANDFKIRDMLMKSGKKIILAVNKIDNEKRKNDIYNYYELGFPDILPISGEHNLGIGDLLDEITKDFTPQEEVNLIDDKIKFCVMPFILPFSKKITDTVCTVIYFYICLCCGSRRANPHRNCGGAGNGRAEL